MNRKNAPQVERTLAEKHQLKDVAWVIRQNRKPEKKNWLIRALQMFFSRLRARMAVRSIRRQARRDGLDKMTLKDVNALIKETRAERKRQ